MDSRKWLIVALVACGLPSACSEYNTNLSIQTASSSLTYVSPSTATVGGQGFTITANGVGFTTGALILWNGTSLVTTLVSGVELTAPVPASYLATAGTVQVAVQIPGSATVGTNINSTTTTEVSNIVFFTISTVSAATPAIGSLSPSSAPFCGSPNGFTLTVNAASGTTFTSDSIVNWNGSARTTTVVNTTQLSAAILPTDTASNATAVVSVSNSSGTSNMISFTMTSPTANLAAPQPVASLTPATALAGSPALTLAVTGAGILPCSVVQWVNTSSGTTSLPTQYVSPTQLNATVPASDLLAAGTAAQVVVFTPGPGGGTTLATPAPAAATFTIGQPPAPAITSLSSSTTMSNTTPYCSPSSFTLTVNGTNLVNGGSVVNWNGSPRPTSYVQPSGSPAPPPYLTAIIPYTDTDAQGSLPITANITVSNGSAISNSLPFSVIGPGTNFPAPTATSLSPTSSAVGSGSFNLVVAGSNFLPCSAVQWNGTDLATSYLSSTQLTAQVPAADSSAAATAQITVFNPAPGGGTSTPISFPVQAPAITSLSASTTQLASTPYCSPADFTLTVTGTNFVNGLVVNWNGSPRSTTFISATQLSADITFADTASPGTATVNVSGLGTSSNSLTFTMSAPTSLPVPSIGSLVPADAAAGGADFVLSVTGTSLLPCSVVDWGAGPLTGTFVPPSGITAAVPAANIATVANVQVTVTTPAPAGCVVGNGVTCGGISNAATFTVYTPLPAGSESSAAVQLADSANSGMGGLLALPLMSSDQRYAVQVLASTDGATEIPGATQNIFVRDTCLGAPSGCTPSNTLVSVGFNNNPADGDSISPSISADGRYVAFVSSATNLVDSDTNSVTDVFVRDTCAGAPSGCTPTTQRASVATDGTQANAASTSATISATGRYVTFVSAATNFGSTSSSPSEIFLRDTCAGAATPCTPSTQPLN